MIITAGTCFKRGVAAHLAQHFEAVHFRHFQVQQHDHRQAVGVAGELAAVIKIIERLGAVAGDHDFIGEIVFFQRGQGQFHVAFAVFGQQDAFQGEP